MTSREVSMDLIGIISDFYWIVSWGRPLPSIIKILYCVHFDKYFFRELVYFMLFFICQRAVSKEVKGCCPFNSSYTKVCMWCLGVKTYG